MVKFLLNTLLSIILGKLKPILLKNIEKVDASMISDEAKRNVVITNFKSDLSTAGKEMRDSLINLVIEAGVNLLKEKLK